MKLLNLLNEITIKPNGPKIWDFTKYNPNFNPLHIKVGDQIKSYTFWSDTPNQVVEHIYSNSKQCIIVDTGEVYYFKELINMNNQRQNDINEITIKPNLNADKVWNYMYDNIYRNDIHFQFHSQAWEEYNELRDKYLWKYGVDISHQWDDNILSNSELQQLYKELQQLVKKYTNPVNESINRFVTIDEIPNILKKEFPNYTSKIGEYISSINIEPSNYEDLTFNDLIQDFQNYLDSELNEITIQPNITSKYVMDNLSFPLYDNYGNDIQVNSDKWFKILREANKLMYNGEGDWEDLEDWVNSLNQVTLNKFWNNIKHLFNINEITIKHNNITVDELEDYWNDNNIFDVFIRDDNKGLSEEYSKLFNKYQNKYGNPYSTDFPQQARNAFYRELQQLVKKYTNPVNEITIQSNVTKQKIFDISYKVNLFSDNVVLEWRRILRKFENNYNYGPIGFIELVNKLPQKGLNNLFKDIEHLVNTQNDLNEITIRKAILNLPPFKDKPFERGNNFKENIINFVKANPYVTEKQVEMSFNFYHPKYIGDNIRKIKELDKVICINPKTNRKVYAYKIKK